MFCSTLFSYRFFNLHFVSNTRAPVTQLQAENGSKHETAQPFLELNKTKTVLTCYRRILFSSNGKLRIHHKTLPIVLIFFAFKFNRASTSWPTQKLLVHTRRTFKTWTQPILFLSSSRNTLLTQSSNHADTSQNYVCPPLPAHYKHLEPSLVVLLAFPLTSKILLASTLWLTSNTVQASPTAHSYNLKKWQQQARESKTFLKVNTTT